MEITLDTVFTGQGLPVNRDWDSFTRPDTTGSTAGVTEGAKAPWTVLADTPGDWSTGVRSNQLSLFRKTLPAASERALAVVDTGKADGVFEMRLNAITGGAQGANGNFVFRVRDKDNFLWVYANDTSKVWSLYRMAGGSPQLITLGTVVASAGQLLRVRMQGPLVTVYVDGVVSAEGSYSNFLDATRHGVAVRASTTDMMTSSRFDDFAFTDL